MCARGSMIDAHRGVVIIASAGVNFNMYARIPPLYNCAVDRKPTMSCFYYNSGS